MSIALNADLERRIANKVESGQYGSPAEVIAASLDLLDARDAHEDNPEDISSRPPIWEVIAAIGRQVPDEEWAKIPADAGRDPDKYLYNLEKIRG